MLSNLYMLDAFLCRYANQQWPALQDMEYQEKRILADCIRALIDGEAEPLDPSGGSGG
jgi:hypothetical protein